MNEASQPSEAKVCSKCGGSGFLYEASLLDGGRYCECTLLQLRLANMDRIWKSLSKAKVTADIVRKPPLLPYVKQNLHITASSAAFRSHFKAVCLHRSTVWDARVRSDADLLDSWLGTTKMQGNHIFDIEIAEQTSLKAIDIPSLIGNFPLIVFVLGVKRLPNRESANSLLEALNYRAHDDLPVWIVDQPSHPITEISHQFYSDQLADRLSEWKHLSLDGGEVKEQRSEATPSVLDSVLEELEIEGDEPAPAPRPKPRKVVEAAGTSDLEKLVRTTAPFKKKKPSRL